MQSLFTLAVGAVWLAYFHPSAWSKISSVMGKLLLAWVIFAVGLRFGVVYASMRAVIEALAKIELPTWATLGPLVVVGLALVLEMLPLFKLTDDDRREESRKKLEAARRPPPFARWYSEISLQR